jgi:hypothetical protein
MGFTAPWKSGVKFGDHTKPTYWERLDIPRPGSKKAGRSAFGDKGWSPRSNDWRSCNWRFSTADEVSNSQTRSDENLTTAPLCRRAFSNSLDRVNSAGPRKSRSDRGHTNFQQSRTGLAPSSHDQQFKLNLSTIMVKSQSDFGWIGIDYFFVENEPKRSPENEKSVELMNVSWFGLENLSWTAAGPSVLGIRTGWTFQKP